MPQEDRSLPLASPDAELPKLSVVIPMLNEAAGIETALAALQPLRESGVEIIVVDGGSTDESVALATPLADTLLTSAPGRAQQMNLGAERARSAALLFLHADTRLPEGACKLISQSLSTNCWGRFDIHLEGKSRWLPLVSILMNLRSRLSGIATGDQGMFLRRASFESVGGFPEQPLMEDIELSKRLKALSPPACLRTKVISSGRRWDQFGAWKTICLMWRLRYRYWRGVSATQLAKEYRNAR
ncbi:TIGR04283 family arsenosugar biosynthesis glycosyltransferase [Halomonas sp. XH26]|uniref:TIGR04283 family arsenosugar biosynthesis glycosyltransferase n=1 Tax=Halomonadaceae TaxID=28256 RepID=UPI0020A2033C|nr:MULTISPECIES: TIGR04283 family arsenosugar biosynthesis glycosyltransferase [Halomonas]UTA81713.1 TIGR04283 family arsenosugar biosynthesis glycosyltransferase [Halomonas sp. XH26]